MKPPLAEHLAALAVGVTVVWILTVVYFVAVIQLVVNLTVRVLVPVGVANVTVVTGLRYRVTGIGVLVVHDVVKSVDVVVKVGAVLVEVL